MLEPIVVGLVFSFVTVLAILGIKMWQLTRLAGQQSTGTAFVSVPLLLRTPWVIAVLVLAFAVGFRLLYHRRLSG